MPGCKDMSSFWTVTETLSTIRGVFKTAIYNDSSNTHKTWIHAQSGNMWHGIKRLSHKCRIDKMAINATIFLLPKPPCRPTFEVILYNNTYITTVSNILTGFKIDYADNATIGLLSKYTSCLRQTYDESKIITESNSY